MVISGLHFMGELPIRLTYTSVVVGDAKMVMSSKSNVHFFFFFFQAEDGIRDSSVTGVQTCALPILSEEVPSKIRCVSRTNHISCSLSSKWAEKHLCSTYASTWHTHTDLKCCRSSVEDRKSVV